MKDKLLKWFVYCSFLSIYLSIYLSTALVDLGSFFNFWILYTAGMAPLTGTSPSQGRYLHTEQQKHRINAHRHHATSGIRTHEPSVRAGEDREATEIGEQFRLGSIKRRETWSARNRQYSYITARTVKIWRPRAWLNPPHRRTLQLLEVGLYHSARFQVTLAVAVATRSKARIVFPRSNAGIVGSNPNRSIDVCLSFILCLCCRVGR
jgi:hypothetical protein